MCVLLISGNRDGSFITICVEHNPLVDFHSECYAFAFVLHMHGLRNEGGDQRGKIYSGVECGPSATEHARLGYHLSRMLQFGRETLQFIFVYRGPINAGPMVGYNKIRLRCGPAQICEPEKEIMQF